MDRAEVAFWLSIVSSCTVIPLALLRGYEFYSDRSLKLVPDVTLTSSDEIGNTIVLLNKSKTPVTMSYYDLVWVERRSIFGLPIPFTYKEVRQNSPIDPPDNCYETIFPHSTFEFWFREDSHFSWGRELKEDIYLRIWLIGRRSPYWIYVTGPSSQ